MVALFACHAAQVTKYESTHHVVRGFNNSNDDLRRYILNMAFFPMWFTYAASVCFEDEQIGPMIRSEVDVIFRVNVLILEEGVLPCHNTSASWASI